MAVSIDPSAVVPKAFAERFRALAGPAGLLRFDAFVELALYDSDVGYYRHDRPRVGYRPGTDFVTATSSGPLFGELVAEACTSLLGATHASQFTFVEVGAEPGSSVLDGVEHPFAAVRTFRLGDTPELPADCILFSNELFDAQPFRRFLFTSGAWQERSVRLRDDDRLETVCGAPESLPPILPLEAPEGYQADLPLAAQDLARSLVTGGWRGLFVAFDYGKTWQQLIEETPEGSARAYWRQQQQTDLLARPGEQDLTCHLCWDWLADELRTAGFAGVGLESQESFLIKRAGSHIERVIAAEATRLSPRKMSLLQLLHPGNMGQKFQVLWGLRGLEDSP